MELLRSVTGRKGTQRMCCALFDRPKDVSGCSAAPEEFLQPLFLLCSFFAVPNVRVCVCVCVCVCARACMRDTLQRQNCSTGSLQMLFGVDPGTQMGKHPWNSSRKDTPLPGVKA